MPSKQLGTHGRSPGQRSDMNVVRMVKAPAQGAIPVAVVATLLSVSTGAVSDPSPVGVTKLRGATSRTEEGPSGQRGSAAARGEIGPTGPQRARGTAGTQGESGTEGRRGRTGAAGT